jgi:hypothetical protein
MKPIKLLDENDSIATIGGYGVAFGGKDLERETFERETNYMLDLVPQKLITYDHRQATPDRPAVKHFLGKSIEEEIDDFGVWVEAELEKSTRYVNQVLELIKKGAIGFSSGSVPHLIERAGAVIKQWPIVEYALTVSPAEPRLLGVEQIKSLVLHDPSLEALLPKEPGKGSSAKRMADRTKQLQTKARLFLLEIES